MTYLQQSFGYADDIEDDLGEEREVLRYNPFVINSYGADLDVEGLVRRLQKEDIMIPSFQRGYVWDFSQACRLIESLLLGLPLPGLFFAEDEEARYLVIDGQQRLKTLLYFYEGHFPTAFDDYGVPTKWRDFSLMGVQKDFEGSSYHTLPSNFRRRLDNTLIHTTIVEQTQPEDDNSSIYLIFERLNTGSNPLSAQEIRASIYHGPFNELLHNLNTDPSWRVLFGKPHPRLRDQELILRFFALYYYREKYTEPFKGFLNSFMAKYRYISQEHSYEFSRLFTETMELILTCLGPRAFKPNRSINAAVMDSVSVGVALAIAQGHHIPCDNLKARYTSLLQNNVYLETVKQNTGVVARVATRLDLAINALTG